jgi:phosphomannomutase/phosphoglucomutase
MYKIITDIDPSIYRGYDIRGLVDKQLSPDIYYTFGKALATILHGKKIDQCQIGRDVRTTSEEYSKALITGLNDGGINTVDIGETLTQITYYSVYEQRSKAAVMITASHNPREFNGLKVSTGYSETFQTEEIQDFRKLVVSGKFYEPEQKGTNREYDILPSYKQDILKRIHLTKKWKVVVDGCNGGAGRICADILRGAGCEVVEQNNEIDGSFPQGAPDPTEEKVLKRVAEGVKKANADIGFSYDSDGDRMAVVDENGNELHMDMAITIFAKSVLRALPGSSIVFNTLCSRAVPEVIQAAGGKPVMWMTGHAFIKKKAIEVGAPFSGELSGHIFFSDNFYGHDDGANASLRLLEALEETGQSLSEAVAEIPHYVSSSEIKLGLADDIKFKFIDETLAKEFRETWPKAKFTTIDGIRADLPDRMAIVRASQNGPYITVKYEGRTREVYDEVRKILREMLEKHPEIDFSVGVNTNAL